MSENLNNEEIKAYINGLEIQIANYISKNSDLLLNVERLRKAGDAMDEVEKCFDGKTPILEGIESVRQIVRRWIKAKEGKPSV